MLICNLGFDRFMSSRSPNVGCYFRLILQIMMLIIEMDLVMHTAERMNSRMTSRHAQEHTNV